MHDRHERHARHDGHVRHARRDPPAILDPHAPPPPGDDGPTQLFQRTLPGHGERCTICPFRPVGTDRAAGTYPPRPVLPFAATSASPPARRGNPTLIAPANTPPAALPRPALLAADLRGSGTLVLPDALRSAGPDTATIEQAHAPRPIDTRLPAHASGRAARDPAFDELASPDITVLQPVLAPAVRPIRPTRPRRPTRVVSSRVYLALNVGLALLILTGLVLLVMRDVPSAAPGVSASQ